MKLPQELLVITLQQPVPINVKLPVVQLRWPFATVLKQDSGKMKLQQPLPMLL
jgi:hypothetical protein